MDRSTPYILDLEGTGFLENLTKIWCLSIRFPDGTLKHYGPDEVEEGIHELNGKHICSHNLIGYDLPAIHKFFPWFTPLNIDDTFILSSLFEPDRIGHGLASWGKQFGVEKPDHEDWSRYSDEMKHRNMEDVKINYLVWQHLNQERTSGWDWEKAIELEYAIAKTHAKQEANGVGFNRWAAIDLKEKIDKEIDEIASEILPQIPPTLKCDGQPILKPFKKDGSLTKQVMDWANGEQVEGPFSRLSYEPINLNSPTQIKEYLLSKGWQPTEFTEKGSPKLTEDSFASVTGEIPSKLARRNILLHRTRMLENTTKQGEEKGLLNQIRKDGRITAGGVPQGTPTGRYRHSGVVNIPKIGTVYGAEIRALFQPKAGYVQVGCDAMALEGRMEAHYCYNMPGGKEYAAELIEGDLHSKNALLFECDRQTAKNVKYACSYGATPPKIALTLKCSTSKAKALHRTFWKNSTALAAFKDEVTRQWNNRGGKNGGYLKGLDGRKLYARSEHSLVNLMFQSAGSIVVKTATILVDRKIEQYGVKAKQMLHFHDEFQHECHPKDVQRLKLIEEESFLEAGQQLGLNVPTPGEVKTGNNWAETH